MKTKLMKTLLAVACLLSSIGASAYDFMVDGICYNITSLTDKTCSVTSGDGYTGDITIPTNVTYNNVILAVTSIGNDAFVECSGLTSVTIPSSVTSIGSAAFYECSGLTDVTIPNSVTVIGEYAFYGCSRLTSLTIPNSVTSIGSFAFSGCVGLTSMPIPNSVTSIGGAAFNECSGLTSVIIPNLVTSIDIATFRNCSGLKDVTIPNLVTSIGGSAFEGCSGLTSMTIPNSVTSIGDNAFYGCSNIKSLVINDGEENLKLGFNIPSAYGTLEGLFSSCPLEYVYIGRALDYESGRHPFYKDNYRKPITEIAFGKYITEIPDYMREFYKLETLTLYNLTPPNASSYYFNGNQYENVNVYVPIGSLEAYQQADVWKDFLCLQEKDLTGIETVVTDGNNTDNVIYDMQGRRLDAPKAGLNIINGKKVMIRK